MCAGNFDPVILAPESLGSPVSRPRFPMPSMSKVRERDAKLAAISLRCVDEYESEDSEDDESDVLTFETSRTYAPTFEPRESNLLPSMRSVREAFGEAYSYGYANE